MGRFRDRRREIREERRDDRQDRREERQEGGTIVERLVEKVPFDGGVIDTATDFVQDKIIDNATDYVRDKIVDTATDYVRDKIIDTATDFVQDKFGGGGIVERAKDRFGGGAIVERARDFVEEHDLFDKARDFVENPALGAFGGAVNLLDRVIPGEQPFLDRLDDTVDLISDQKTKWGAALEWMVPGVDAGWLGLPGIDDSFGDLVDIWRPQPEDPHYGDQTYPEYSGDQTEDTIGFDPVGGPTTEITGDDAVDGTVPSYQETGGFNPYQEEQIVPYEPVVEDSSAGAVTAAPNVSCRKMTCEESCAEKSKIKQQTCEEINRRYEARAKEIGCKGVRCTTKFSYR